MRNVLALLLLAPLALPVSAEPVRLSMPLFAGTAQIEVRDLPTAQAEQAIQSALEAMFEAAWWLEPDGTAPHGIGALNRAAGGDAIVLAPELIPLLQRALAFCLWSDSSWSPLGGHVYAQWERLEGGVEVDPVRFDQALRGAACELVRIDIDPEGGDTRVALAAGSRVDLRAMAQGFAVDRAVETLTAAGASNLWVETPRVVRGLGGGAAGRGWYFEPPTFPGQQRSIEAVYLRDRSVAWVSTNDPTPRGDMRTGSLASGTVAVLVSTPGAADAQAVAASLFVLSHYVGQRRLGQLDPKPAVLWMLGEGDGPPLESSYQWTKISRP